MTRIMILGAGGVGRVVAHKCAGRPDLFSDILLASRTESRCREIADDVGPVIRTAGIDADDTEALTRLLEAERPFIVINVALPYQDLSVMDACLAAGVHYLDTANYEPPDEARFAYHWQWAYEDRFREAGLTAILGSGFDPGVTNAYVAWLAKHRFDEIHELDIIDVNAGTHGRPFATNFNPEINIREVTAPCRAWEDGRFVESPALGARAAYSCPEDLGEYTIYQMYHEELESLVRHFPSIRRARFWMSFSDEYLRYLEVLQDIGMTSIDPVDYEGRPIVPLQFLKAVLPDPATLGPESTGKTCIGCTVRGIRNGTELIEHVFNICDHEKAYAETGAQAISYTTGVPAMVGAAMVVGGQWREPGVWNIEQLDPDPFLSDLAEYGLPWATRRLEEFSLETEMVR